MDPNGFNIHRDPPNPAPQQPSAREPQPLGHSEWPIAVFLIFFLGLLGWIAWLLLHR